jgi:uncharacterized protein (UPF0548 family)
MFLLVEPSHKTVAGFVARQRELQFTYEAVGATNGTPPDGFTLDHNRMKLGTGSMIFERATEALKTWRTV